ncbi:fatty acid synthase-like isoform X2 [Planococcus citri]|uniref:fatty acid synthase-like isoform X2 n=1 Tax=Planococcus citri TaxID=170843 RepID=UPI0031F8B42E
MQNFIETLQEKNIFARKVNSANIPSHSRYIASRKLPLLSYLNKVIPEPKIRSKKWICTSVLEHNWDNEEVKYCSAEYQSNNFVNPVYFEEGCRHIPDNAITIEIAPHGLLNAILKRSLPETVHNIPLTRKNSENSVEYLLSAFGQLYEAGSEMELSHLYPEIEFPVSRSTPMISPLIKWKYEKQQNAYNMSTANTNQSYERHYTVDPNSEEYNYLRGHVIGDRNLFPGSGYLWMVAEAISMIKKKPLTRFPIIFENIHFEQAVTIPSKGSLYFHIVIQDHNNQFEVKYDEAVVAQGKVRILENTYKDVTNIEPFKNEISNSDILPLNIDDFYKELRLRGYQYDGLFKNVQYVNGTYGELSWSKNFVTFIDTMLQITVMHVDTRVTLVPTFIRKVVVDFQKHFEILESLDKENPKFPVLYHSYHNSLSAGGIQMSGWRCAEISRQRKRADQILQRYYFVPNISNEKMDLNTAVDICTEIGTQNTLIINAITYELIDQDYSRTGPSISVAVLQALHDRPAYRADVNILTNSIKPEETEASSEITVSNGKLPNNKTVLMVILSHIQNKIESIESILEALRDDGFILTREPVAENVPFEKLGFNVCFSRIINDTEKIMLLNKLTKTKPIKQTIQIKYGSYSWVPEVQTAISNLDSEKDEKLILYAEKQPNNGILGFFNCLRKEDKGKHIRCFFIMDDNAPSFSLDDPFYKSQYDKDLSYNVYKDGKWGGYWHSSLNALADVESSHAFCTLEERGNLSSFKWIEGSLDPLTYEGICDEKFLVYVYYCGINFKDVMLSTGRISPIDLLSYSRLSEGYIGGEFSGKDKDGRRLMGILHVQGKGISTMVEASPLITWNVPDSMTLEEAASVPIVYSTVIFAFFVKMTLKEGLSVLIHSGSGGVGQAAINICLHYKCNIFTTVGTAEKREFIRKAFPQNWDIS